MTGLAYAIITIRAIGLFFILLGMWLGIANMIESLGDFNPAYAYHYFQSELLSPLVAFTLGILTIISSRSIATLCIKGIENKDKSS